MKVKKNNKSKWDNRIKLGIAIDLIGVFLFLFIMIYQVFTRGLGVNTNYLNLSVLFYISIIFMVIGCFLLLYSSMKKKEEK